MSLFESLWLSSRCDGINREWKQVRGVPASKIGRMRVARRMGHVATSARRRTAHGTSVVLERARIEWVHFTIRNWT